jgi:hypothetical protein
VVLKRADNEPFVMRSLFVEAQRRRDTTQVPVENGLVWVCEAALSDDDIRQRLAPFDNLPRIALVQIANTPASLAPLTVPGLTCVASFRVVDGMSSDDEIRPDLARIGRRVVLKLYGGRQGRLDVSLLRVCGTPGPFHASQHDSPLTSVVNVGNG